MKKILTIVMVLVLAITLFACGSNDNTEDNNPSSEPTNQNDSSNNTNKGNDNTSEDTSEDSNVPSYYSEEPTTLRMFFESSPSWPYDKDWKAWDWIRENTNISVEGEIPAGNYGESLALKIASRELADLVHVWLGDSMKYGSQGVFVNLVEHLDKMPNVKKYLEENPAIQQRITSADGEIYYIVGDGAGITNYIIWFYRDDILAEHNIDTPGTWEEMHDASLKLKEIYPDSFPFTFRHGMRTLQFIAPSFETWAGVYPHLETGKATYGPIEDNFKEMITWLNRFHEDELMPPDWLSINYKQWTEYMANSKGHFTLQYIGQRENMNNQMEDGHFEFLAPPAPSTGKQYIQDSNYETAGLAINTDTEKLEESLMLMDYLFSEEGKQKQSWGEEGVTYQEVNGKRTYLDQFEELTELRKDFGIMTYGTYGQFDSDAVLSMIPEEDQKAYELAAEHVFPIQVHKPALTIDEQDIYDQYYPPISKHYEENMSKFILGKRSLDEWDQFVQEIKDLHIDKIIDIYQDGWDRTQ